MKTIPVAQTCGPQWSCCLAMSVRRDGAARPVRFLGLGRWSSRVRDEAPARSGHRVPFRRRQAYQERIVRLIRGAVTSAIRLSPNPHVHHGLVTPRRDQMCRSSASTSDAESHSSRMDHGGICDEQQRRPIAPSWLPDNHGGQRSTI